MKKKYFSLLFFFSKLTILEFYRSVCEKLIIFFLMGKMLNIFLFFFFSLNALTNYREKVKSRGTYRVELKSFGA